MTVDLDQYLGKETLERAKRTKWWALARLVDQMIYDGAIVNKPEYPESADKDFRCPARVYVGEVGSGLKILGLDGRYIETNKGLRELMHECERMAVKEVT